MKLHIESAKTKAGTRKLPMTDEAARCSQAIIEDREKPGYEKMIEGHTYCSNMAKSGMNI